jgi:transposase-like protein
MKLPKYPESGSADVQLRRCSPRIRLQVVPDCSARILEQSVKANVTPGSTVETDGWIGYNFLDESSYIHDQVVASHIAEKESILPGVYLIASLVKRLIISTFQGRFDPKHLQSYLDEYVFRFNRRTSRNIGKKFMRIAQQATASTITTYEQIKAGASRFSLLAN